jgi:Short C-terminal domain
MDTHPHSFETVHAKRQKGDQMFMRRRRPLMGAAMLGGAVYAGRKSQQTQYREQEQEQRLEGLEQQQATPAPAPAPLPAAPPAAAGASLVDQLKQLSDLKASGALSAQEFEAAKQKLLAS